MPIVRPVVVIGLLVLGLVGGLNNVVTDRTQAGEIAAAIKSNLQPGDVVVMCPDQLGPSTHRLLPASVEQFTYPAFGSPDRVDWRDYGARNANADPTAFAGGVVDRATRVGRALGLARHERELQDVAGTVRGVDRGVGHTARRRISGGRRGRRRVLRTRRTVSLSRPCREVSRMLVRLWGYSPIIDPELARGQ